MKDGLYRVHFETQLGAGSGVVVLQAGKLRGGDSRTFYVGTYSENGSQFAAQVVTDKHSDTSGIFSVFGVDRAHITLTGTTSGDSTKMSGTATERPGIRFGATLTRISD
ncbi:MAG: hypothetical protein ACYDC3_11720 [Candidatus Binataceae bacterium]